MGAVKRGRGQRSEVGAIEILVSRAVTSEQRPRFLEGAGLGDEAGEIGIEGYREEMSRVSKQTCWHCCDGGLRKLSMSREGPAKRDAFPL